MATDTSGNKSFDSKKLTIVYDIEPPEIEITSPQNEQSFSGTANKQINIEGKTDAGVKVTINERIAIVNSDGNFRLSTTLADGDNEFTVLAEDEAGNSSENKAKSYLLSLVRLIVIKIANHARTNI